MIIKHFSMKKYFLIALTLCLFLPQVADAAIIVRSGESVSLGASQVAEGDLYAAGGSVSISGTVDGDLYAAGGSLTLNGEVIGDTVFAGDSIGIHGQITDDLRLAGRDVVIADMVEGDVIVFGDTLRVLSTAIIGGDVVFFGRSLEISGEVDGSLTGNAESMTINGFVGGDVDVTSSRPLTLGERANIEGDIRYASSKELVRAQGSVVVGTVERKESTGSDDTFFEAGILPLFVLLFTSLVYLFLFKDQMEALLKHVKDSYGKQGLVGLGTLILTPFVAVVLMLTLVGFGIGLLLLLVYATAVVFAWSLGGIFTGALLAKLFKKEFIINWQWTVVGTIAFFLLGLIPFLGWLAALIIMLVLLGGMVTTCYNRLK